MFYSYALVARVWLDLAPRIFLSRCVMDMLEVRFRRCDRSRHNNRNRRGARFTFDEVGIRRSRK